MSSCCERKRHNAYQEAKTGMCHCIWIYKLILWRYPWMMSSWLKCHLSSGWGFFPGPETSPYDYYCPTDTPSIRSHCKQCNWASWVYPIIRTKQPANTGLTGYSSHLEQAMETSDLGKNHGTGAPPPPKVQMILTVAFDQDYLVAVLRTLIKVIKCGSQRPRFHS